MDVWIKDWSIIVSNSIEKSTTGKHFCGTEQEVKELLVQMIQKDCLNNEKDFINGTEKSEDVAVSADGTLIAFADYAQYHIKYRAEWRTNFPVLYEETEKDL